MENRPKVMGPRADAAGELATNGSENDVRSSGRRDSSPIFSATGMQVIPATGVAMGIQYKEKLGLNTELGAIVVCSLGDASVTEGEISEALQMAALKQFPILYLVQDNGWDISATAAETRAMNAFEYAKGFPGIEAVSIDGIDFAACYQTLDKYHSYHEDGEKTVFGSRQSAAT